MDSRRTFLRPARERRRRRGREAGPPVGCGGRASGSGEATRSEPRSTEAEKSRRSAGARRPVPQTDTGGWVEQTKVRERNHVKELGKIAP